MSITLTIDQARELDRRATKELGIPSLILMEHAGVGVAQAALTLLEKQPVTAQVIIVAGGGSNGGDAFVAARHIQNKNGNVHVYLLTSTDRIKGDALTNFQILKKMGVPIRPFQQFEKDLEEKFHGLPLVVIDGILGTGFKGELRPAVAGAIGFLNALKKSHSAKVSIISVDIPSGVNGDKGPLSSDPIKANETVTFVAWKKGLVSGATKPFAGKITVVDIGIPDALLQQVATPPPVKKK